MLVAGDPGIGRRRSRARRPSAPPPRGGRPLRPLRRGRHRALRALGPRRDARRRHRLPGGARAARRRGGRRSSPASRPSCADASPTSPPRSRPSPTRSAGACSTRSGRSSTTSPATGPVVVVLDDLHWADRSTLLLLRHLLRSRPHSRLLVIGTYRAVELAPEGPLASAIADLRREHLFSELELAGLTEPEVAALVARRRGADPDPAFVRALHEETEGNPFFAEEVLRNLPEPGSELDAQGRLAGDRVPPRRARGRRPPPRPPLPRRARAARPGGRDRPRVRARGARARRGRAGRRARR